MSPTFGAAGFERPRVVLMQPAFLPWQGTFALIAAADVVVFLDDFQFSRQSWQQRNQLFTSHGQVGWVTVPVNRHCHGAGPPTLLQAKPILTPFRRKFLSTLRQTYGHTRHAAEFLAFVSDWLGEDWPNVASMNIAFIRGVAEKLGLAPRFLRSSALGFAGTRSAAVKDLLCRLDARTYLSQAGSFRYMLEDGVFPLKDIDVRFQDFAPAPYQQQHSTSFASGLSILDSLFHVGAEETADLLEKGALPFRAWNQMLAETAAHAGRDREWAP